VTAQITAGITGFSLGVLALALKLNKMSGELSELLWDCEDPPVVFTRSNQRAKESARLQLVR
jgi:hypothetical protein